MNNAELIVFKVKVKPCPVCGSFMIAEAGQERTKWFWQKKATVKNFTIYVCSRGHYIEREIKEFFEGTQFLQPKEELTTK